MIGAVMITKCYDTTVQHMGTQKIDAKDRYSVIFLQWITCGACLTYPVWQLLLSML
jgi:hypothetical protein